MSEVKAIEAVDNALEPLSVDERVRVLNWAQSKYGATSKTDTSAQASHPLERSTAAAPTNPPVGPTRAKGSKKSKTIISMDKALNLSPPGKISGTQFATDKNPSNVMQKCVTAVYYLREFIEIDKISVQSVFTFFKHLNWPIPTDLKNTLQQAGTAGWLDTADSQDIKLTSLGENLIEHELPSKAKTK